MAVDATAIAALAALGGAIAAPLIGKLVPARKTNPNREQALNTRVEAFINRQATELDNCAKENAALARRVTDLETELGKVRVELEQWKAGIRRRSGEDEA